MLTPGSLTSPISRRPILDNLGAGIGGGIGAALGSIIGTDIAYRQTQPEYLRSLTPDQRARYQRYWANQRALMDVSDENYTSERDYKRAIRRLRKERPELFEKIDLSDLPERRLGNFAPLVGAGLGALTLGYAGNKIQQSLKHAEEQVDDDIDDNTEEPDAPAEKRPGILRRAGRGALALLAGGAAGVGTQAVAGGMLMSELGSNADPGSWNLGQSFQWNADKRMVANWLRRKGIKPHIRRDSSLSPYIGPHAVPGRDGPRKLNASLRSAGMWGDYWPDSIVNPWNHAGIMAHEAGHIANFHDKKRLLNFFLRNDAASDAALSNLGQLTRGDMPFYSQASGVGLAALASKDLGRHAWALPLLGSAPLIGEEALASLRGLNEIRQQRGLGAAISATPALAKALATYAAMPAGMSLAAYLINRWKPDDRTVASKVRRDKARAKSRNKKRREEEELEEPTLHKAAGLRSLTRGGHARSAARAKLAAAISTAQQKRILKTYLTEKLAGSASLLRHVTRLVDAGKKVPWDILDQLAKKTQSTAKRQAEHLHREVPLKPRGDIDTGQWLRTTGKTPDQMIDRAIMADSLKKNIASWRKDVNDSMGTSIWRKFRDTAMISFQDKIREAFGQTGRLQKGLLAETLAAQKELRATSLDIGRYRGAVTPTPPQAMLPRKVVQSPATSVTTPDMRPPQ